MRPHIHPRGRLALLFLATALEITRINHSYVFHGERERERERFLPGHEMALPYLSYVLPLQQGEEKKRGKEKERGSSYFRAQRRSSFLENRDNAVSVEGFMERS